MPANPLSENILHWIKGLNEDAIVIRRAFIDVCKGDIIAGLILSQVLYYHLLDKTGKTRLRVIKKGKFWLAKQYTDWWEECRIKATLARNKINELVEDGILEKRIFKFNGMATVHLRVNCEVLESRIKTRTGKTSSNTTEAKPADMQNDANGFEGTEQTDMTKTNTNGCDEPERSGVSNSGKPLTEITSDTTDIKRERKKANIFPGKADFANWDYELNGPAPGKVFEWPENKFIEHPISQRYAMYSTDIRCYDHEIGSIFELLILGFHWGEDEPSARLYYEMRKKNIITNNSVRILYRFLREAYRSCDSDAEPLPASMAELLNRFADIYEVVFEHAEMELSMLLEDKENAGSLDFHRNEYEMMKDALPDFEKAEGALYFIYYNVIAMESQLLWIFLVNLYLTRQEELDWPAVLKKVRKHLVDEFKYRWRVKDFVETGLKLNFHDIFGMTRGEYDKIVQDGQNENTRKTQENELLLNPEKCPRTDVSLSDDADVGWPDED